MDGLIRLVQLHSPSSFRPLLPDLAVQLQAMVTASPSVTGSKALSVITEICRCIKDPECWRDFGEVLMSKIALDLQQGLDSVQATTAVVVARAVAESSVEACVGVFHRMLPILSRKLSASVEAVRSSLLSSLNEKSFDNVIEPSVNSFHFVSALVQSVEPGITYITAPIKSAVLSPIIDSLSKLLSELVVEGHIDFDKVIQRDVKVYVNAIECLGDMLAR